MYELKKNDRNEITFDIKNSPDSITLYYRDPESSERLMYQKKLFKTDKNKIKDVSAQTRIEFGTRILTGIKDGCVSYDGKPLSSDPQNENYNPNWKNILVEAVPHLVASMAFNVFEGFALASDNMQIELDDSDGEELPPLK